MANRSRGTRAWFHASGSKRTLIEPLMVGWEGLYRLGCAPREELTKELGCSVEIIGPAPIGTRCSVPAVSILTVPTAGLPCSS